MRELLGKAFKGFRETDKRLKTSGAALDTSKPVIAVDFDGTLVKNRYPFIEFPNHDLLEWIRENRDRFTFILWTCRHGLQLQYAVEWLDKEQGIVFDLINENVSWQIEKYGDCRKIWADYYIDDKAITTYKDIIGL